MSDVVEIGKFSSEFEAQLAVAHLRSEGIESTMITDDGGGAIPTLTMLTGGVRVLVRSDDAAKAESSLRSFDQADGDEAT